MSRVFRQIWYAAARLMDETGARVDSIALSAWLAAATGRWPRGIRADGLPRIRLHPSSALAIGDDVRLISRYGLNAVGGQQRVIIWVGPSASVSIGDHAGLSHATIVALSRIDIGRGVLIGGGVRIFDSDFHALPSAGPSARTVVTLPVKIDDHAFIGAHATILKGVTIGRGAVVGAGSVVTTNVPPHEVWAGNPARRISASIMAKAVSL
jgi:acetyltransferase-like isoleucine patch superfamily enzyme